MRLKPVVVAQHSLLFLIIYWNKVEWFTVPVILITFAWYISVLLPKKNVMSLKVASMYKAT